MLQKTKIKSNQLRISTLLSKEECDNLPFALKELKKMAEILPISILGLQDILFDEIMWTIDLKHDKEWFIRIIETIEQGYTKAAQFDQVYGIKDLDYKEFIKE